MAKFFEIENLSLVSVPFHWESFYMLETPKMNVCTTSTHKFSSVLKYFVQYLIILKAALWLEPKWQSFIFNGSAYTKFEVFSKVYLYNTNYDKIIYVNKIVPIIAKICDTDE